jgi:hypothetical protein
MSQGMRGRVALIGAGVVCCSGLVGCLFDEKGKTPPPVSKAKAGVVTPPGARTTVPDIRPTGGNGIPVGGGFERGVVPPGGYPAGAPNPYNTGAINAPVVPGNHGAGAPLPGATPTIPSVTPPPSQYPPAGAAVPPDHGSSNALPLPTTARGVAPTNFPVAPSQPPTPMLAELQPPPPPGGIVSPADTAPPVARVGANPSLPLAPPNAPR